MTYECGVIEVLQKLRDSTLLLCRGMCEGLLISQNMALDLQKVPQILWAK